MSTVSPLPAGSHLPQVEQEALEKASQHAAMTGRLRLQGIASAASVFVQDIAELVERFSDQMLALRQAGIECPMVYLDTGTLAPLDVVGSTKTRVQRLPMLSDALLQQLVYDAADDATSAGLNVVPADPATAEGNFGSLLTEFLIHRTESALGFFGPGASASTATGPGSAALPGTNIVVQTYAQNLQILYSPAFFPNVQTGFGNGLSTPVIGAVNPGLYIFGASGPAIGVRFESTQHQIPPTSFVQMTTV
jgi:hypothetical protein